MRRNIGVFAHVDAGKTTLSQRLLQHTGSIRSVGAVDAGTAHTDRLEIERRRGISVQAALAPMVWKGVDIRLIDTPGHSDFAAEVERSIWALDGAVLVVSAVEGVQPLTEAVFQVLKDNRIPALIFINKIDRSGADPLRVLRQIRSMLNVNAALLSDSEDMMASLADLDEEAMTMYLEGSCLSETALQMRLIPYVHACNLYPVVCGSALRDQGIEELLDAIITYLPAPQTPKDAETAGIVFAIDSDPVMGTGAMVRLFAGTLANRQGVSIQLQKVTAYSEQTILEQRKITQIRELTVDGKGRDTGIMKAGDIACVYGLHGVRVGTVIGSRSLIPRRITAGEYRKPLMMVKVVQNNPDDRAALHKALTTLAAQDPLLDVRQYNGVEHIRVMGAIQLEVLKEVFEHRFGLAVTFGPPQVIYRETIREAATGFVAYLAPKPCWAVIKFWIEPLPRGSGVEFRSITPVRRIQERYQHQIEQALPIALSQGMLGWTVDDVRITLEDGEDHQFHTHPLDFIVATPMALMDGLRRGGSQLLEPIAEMRITVHSSLAGKIMTEITAMRGQTLDTALIGDEIVLTAHVPVATSMEFPMRLQMLTSGHAQLSIKLHGYRDCPIEEGCVCERVGVHPLDTSKYILAARNALDGQIF